MILRLRCGDLRVGYFDLDVHYRGIVPTMADVELLKEAAWDRRTEVLYDELDREPDGVFVHRLLCEGTDGGRELTFRFQELALSRTPRQQRWGRLGWPRRRYLEIPSPPAARP